MKTSELRKIFLDYFQQHGHTIVPSSSLVPVNDPSLLFTNAGMVQFKDVFLGADIRSYKRAASSQRCVRAGGKHNDLENVGFTARHHTFFEMLGNFSFGDYFKREAIQYAWDFITNVLKLPVERLWVTVYEEDHEAEEIWLKEVKIDATRFSRCGKNSNFWAMGDTGPCGPCTEIFYDHGKDIPGGPPGTPEEDGDRYIEIWNLVFMQYNRDEAGNLSPLPKPSVDTGMGLERIAAIMQGVHSNYEIDIFANLIQAIAKLTATKDLTNKSLRVIADHLRSCAFLVADGVFPSNEGRGYVLRRIMRRAIRHGHNLGMQATFFHKLVPDLVQEMGTAFPELVSKQEQIARAFEQEEVQFASTLEQGLKIIADIIAGGKKNIGRVLSGDIVFKLYDTYGFPVDLTRDIARDHGMTIDEDGFNAAMEEQKSRARGSKKFTTKGTDVHSEQSTIFVGYDTLASTSKIVEIFKDGVAVDSLSENEQGMLILDSTSFYAEAGGQVGDTGRICIKHSVVDLNAKNHSDNREYAAIFRVNDTQLLSKAYAHVGEVVHGRLRVGDEVAALVDPERRASIKLNHSATHLLHAALRKVLGAHVEQKGSIVTADKLRFDFSHHEPVTQQQLWQIEQIVNTEIRSNSAVETKVMSLQDARNCGAMALFGEKYSEQVRVLKMGNGFSIELCGGTHAVRTGDIGLLKIIIETGIAAGVRRIEAVTGEYALTVVQSDEQCLTTLTELVKSSRDGLADRVAQLVTKVKTLERSVTQMQADLIKANSGELASFAKEVHGVKVLATTIAVNDAKLLRETVDKLKMDLNDAVIVLAAVNEGKISLVAGVTKNCIAKITAKELVNYVAVQVGGKGGGRDDMAQAGGEQPENLEAALSSVLKFVMTKLE